MPEIVTAAISGAVTLLVCIITQRANSKKLVADARKESQKETEAQKLGLQALLRDRLYSSYNKYNNDLGYAPLYAKENFMNMYEQYHNLGANGVMDRLKDEFMELPTKEEKLNED